ncbi:MAG: zinc ribbon domain-containing protein [Candidatus Lokiarchaeota archaeon]|nr:zinc ribbon domain-containing protein [Candidatus Lokiarchaeota archaeon]
MGFSEERCPSCKLALNFRVVNDVSESESIHKAEGKFCNYCNIKLDQDSMFCKLCGRAIRKPRYISLETKREVWRRDMGRCVECGSKELLE